MRDFYGRTLGLPFVADDADSISFRAGHTVLTFENVEEARHGVPGRPNPFYHFAFNIPENRLAEALEWLRPRTPIVRKADGSEVFHFDAWNAHAFYFLDLAGNIVEFIARHTLRNASTTPFAPDSIGDVSEIGLVVPDVPAAVRMTADALGAAPYLNRISDEFAAVGDERGLFILVKTGRLWFPLEGARARAARVFPTKVTTRGPAKTLSPFDGLPYTVNRA
jgi:catechol-2,3-dioxygenase